MRKWRTDSVRSGLTLVETLAAVVLLASVAAACASGMRALRMDDSTGAALEPAVASAAAERVADVLVKSPQRLGVEAMTVLTESPRRLRLDDELGAEVRRMLERVGSKAGDQPLPRVLARRVVVSRTSQGPVRGVEPCWLLVEVDGAVAVRCVTVRTQESR